MDAIRVYSSHVNDYELALQILAILHLVFQWLPEMTRAQINISELTDSHCRADPMRDASAPRKALIFRPYFVAKPASDEGSEDSSKVVGRREAVLLGRISDNAIAPNIRHSDKARSAGCRVVIIRRQAASPSLR